MLKLSYPIEMEISGNTAMWTRPDTGDCPVSYPAPTYSAVKAIFESVLWGPDIEIIPTKVELCNPGNIIPIVLITVDRCEAHLQ